MTITYSDGRAVEAALLSRTGETIRVAIRGADDVTQFQKTGGTWVSENCEVARIEFACEQAQRERSLREAPLPGSQDQGVGLIHLMLTAGLIEDDVEPASAPAFEAALAFSQSYRSNFVN
jgi:hypothetical protein